MASPPSLAAFIMSDSPGSTAAIITASAPVGLSEIGGMSGDLPVLNTDGDGASSFGEEQESERASGSPDTDPDDELIAHDASSLSSSWGHSRDAMVEGDISSVGSAADMGVHGGTHAAADATPVMDSIRATADMADLSLNLGHGAAVGGTADGDASSRQRTVHVYILSSSGKPIYSSHGDDGQLAALTALITGLVSVVQEQVGHAWLQQGVCCIFMIHQRNREGSYRYYNLEQS